MCRLRTCTASRRAILRCTTARSMTRHGTGHSLSVPMGIWSRSGACVRSRVSPLTTQYVGGPRESRETGTPLLPGWMLPSDTSISPSKPSCIRRMLRDRSSTPAPTGRGRDFGNTRLVVSPVNNDPDALRPLGQRQVPVHERALHTCAYEGTSSRDDDGPHAPDEAPYLSVPAASSTWFSGASPPTRAGQSQHSHPWACGRDRNILSGPSRVHALVLPKLACSTTDGSDC